MKNALSITLFIIIAFSTHAQTEDANKEMQNTWTYTYIKAKEDQRNNLKQFLIKNWFKMDSIAVQRGLFNDYKLLENSSASSEIEWDYIVAVEYYTKGTYSDIQDEWMEIRSNHQTVKIDGYSFPELGAVVKSENLIDAPELKEIACEGDQFEILKPFIGQWHEYLVEAGGDQLYGNLSIAFSTGCSLRKDFSMLTSSFSYKTLGYYDNISGTWKETYTFSNGGYAIYEWKREKEEVVMQLINSSFPTIELKRNRWTNVTENSFQIISEKSTDSGKTWETSSITNMKRIGK